ncbi:3-oxoacyl-[acyl-carrier-protein] reductase [Salibacterium halotolerans]|uniref:3-oxoacyl-[acyl-carrier-protein] reductase n=1 Tax=Salibacterium halotolerans TaxID=1884432 RepID=A0A1I5MBS8_9BACI|nr:3-oxoacyl-[acyl-carrier-protein] reductase [Salibacterium halotolerans]SFP06406.1 3-oxoacyl-[acyl-carrier protein] reductase [Salibacterium halotolerans]
MFNGKTALVTGASRGIGKAIALELAASGANVAVNYSGSAQKAEEVAAACRDQGVKAFSVQADVAVEEDVKAMIKEVTDQFGQLDILINNAGITRDNLLMRMREEDWDAVLDTNLKGVYHCAKSASRQMMKQRSGKIVNISSVVGVMGNAGQANYSAAKAGVLGLTKSLAREFAPRNIQVNAVAPGFIETEMTEELDEKTQESLLQSIPLGRLGEAREVARAVRFLASGDADYMTGQTLQIDGGMVMH